MKMTRTQRVLGNWLIWISERVTYLRAWVKFGRAGVIETKAMMDQRKNQLRYRLGKNSADKDTLFELQWEEENRKRKEGK
jgi:hypothetical protein